MKSIELGGKTCEPKLLNTPERAGALSSALIESAWNQVDRMHATNPKFPMSDFWDPSIKRRAERQREVKKHLIDSIFRGDFEPGSELFQQHLQRPHGILLGLAVSLSENPRNYEVLLPALQAKAQTDPQELGELFQEIAVESGFFVRLDGDGAEQAPPAADAGPANEAAAA